jgi:hypothetical protein
MKQTKNLIGIWGKTTKTLAVLASFVLLSLSFSSCKDCGKNNKGGDPGNRNTLSQTSSGDGSSNGGNPSQVNGNPTDDLQNLQNKIKEVMGGFLDPDTFKMTSFSNLKDRIVKDTPNAFTMVCLRVYNVYNIANDTLSNTSITKWLNTLESMYCNRLVWACHLYQEYIDGIKNPHESNSRRKQADNALNNKKENYETNEFQKTLAEIDTFRINKSRPNLIKDWDALYDNASHDDSKLMRDANKQWDELVKIVDAYRAAHP